MPTRFERDTEITRIDGGSDGVQRFAARVDRAWWVQNGPNGGYVAAIILKALTAAVDDPERAPRSLTIHYTAPPAEGEIEISTRVERTGQSLSSSSARVTQGDRLIALAIAAFSKPREGPEFCDIAAPDAPPATEVPVVPPHAEAPGIAHRWEARYVLGRPGFTSPPTGEAVTGGWIRLEEPQILGAPAIAAMTDAWIPPVFSRLDEPFVVPTVDLTVHFRTSLPLAGATPDDYFLVVFRTNAAAEGFLEEDGEVWSADGLLVAQSRQLAVVTPFTG